MCIVIFRLLQRQRVLSNISNLKESCPNNVEHFDVGEIVCGLYMKLHGSSEQLAAMIFMGHSLATPEFNPRQIEQLFWIFAFTLSMALENLRKKSSASYASFRNPTKICMPTHRLERPKLSTLSGCCSPRECVHEWCSPRECESF